MTRKLDKEHIDSIQELQQRFAQNRGWIGSVSIDIKYLEQQLDAQQRRLDELYRQYEQLQEQESALLDTLKARYGDGEINVEAGTFTPAG
jgi:TolA-binding protein